jgi:hypothetical protein
MSFNKKYIKPLPEVKEELERRGLDEFVHIYSRADAFIGNAESITFINNTISQYYNDKRLGIDTLDKHKSNRIMDILSYPKRFIRKHLFKR